MRNRPVRRMWPRRRGRGRGNLPLLLASLIGVGLALLVIHTLDAALRPQLVALAEAQVKNHITRVANDAVSNALTAEALTYDEMVTLRPGEVTTLTADTLRLNALRTAVLEDIIAQVEDPEQGDLGVPIGALTGLDLLSGTGPKVPVRVLSVASAEAVYRNDFTGAGLNQTLHRILLDVTVTAKLLLPGGVVETKVATPVCVAETVIVGQVPQAYLPR